MFLELLYPLVKYFTAFNVFQYISFRSAYAAVTALFISFIFGPKIIMLLKKLKAGQEIREDGPQTHLVKAGTPTMGGILIILAIVVSILLWMDLHNIFTWIILTSLIGFGILGFIDDSLKIFQKNSKGLSPRLKLTGQIFIAGIIVIWTYCTNGPQSSVLYLPFVKKPVLDLGLLYIPFGIFFLVGFSNAVNLTDGLDGLATGLVMMAGIGFAIITYLSGRLDYSSYLQIPFLPGSGELSIFSFALVGACVGFLWFNTHPAEVMMGDTGSLALGGVLGTLSLLIKKEILLLIIGGVFVLETLSVMIQVFYFKRTGKRIFRMAPLHHHFELSGWAESKVVIRMWILGGLFVILALSTLKLQ
ncbi:phospho-N-acetylmuramoyl-pentapeptide-transferase [Spirochaeta cellobiosiphila]|uniref:phospho-N-acetylmuramoyl-pentapeptide- transferase n=1 Tax=Spirochaeta cellobiosiphila TaxID=504483 RepID=UPI00041D24E1|nr:phospho-N-acetylmuramoyl-pentapeptide-transferase [Spirochaeta cellobiosiphila]